MSIKSFLEYLTLALPSEEREGKRSEMFRKEHSEKDA
jgi:hypothetical protein